MRCIEFRGSDAYQCRGRGGSRHCEHFSADGAPIKPNPRLDSSMQETQDADRLSPTVVLSTSSNCKVMISSKSGRRTSASPVEKTDGTGRSLKRQSYPASSSWMRLSHLGHVSDYHGIQRQFESFLPLTLKSSASEMVLDIQRTLQEHHFDESFESDEEVMEEKSKYRRALASYVDTAKREEASKGRVTPEGRALASESGDHVLPVLFGGGEQVPVVSKCPARPPCTICRFPAENAAPCVMASRHSFRLVDSGPLDFWNPDDKVNNFGRPSRRNAIILQRKASLSMLFQLQQSLKFIAAYNTGNEDAYHVNSTASDGISDSPVQGKPPSMGTRGKSNKRRPADEMKRKLLGNAKAESHEVVYDLASLTLENLADECIQYSKRQDSCPIVCMSRKPSIQSLREFLKAVDDHRTESPSEEDLAELRNYQRVLRSYSGKADQERIEKLRHEEQRDQGVLYRSRARKPSPEDLELADLETRSVLFMHVSGVDTSCLFGTSCIICRVNEKLVGTNASLDATILHPSIRRVDENLLLMNEETTVENLRSRRNRSRDKASRRHAEAERLGHIRRRLDFVEQYNKGWIVSSSRRRK